MISRRALLYMSVILSLAFHAGLLSVSSRLPMQLAPWRKPLPHKELFRVQIKDIPPLPLPTESVALHTGPLASRPGSVEALLQREFQRLKPAESFWDKAAELPRLAERVAADTLQREHDLTPDPAMMARADAKIIEISATQARQDIQVPRRYVQPGSTRILEEHEMPFLRREDEEPEDLLLFAGQPADFALGASGGSPALPALDSSREPVAELPRTLDTSLPAIQEPVASPAPIADEIAAEKKYEFLDDMVDVRLEAFVPSREDRGYFRLQIMPKEGARIQVLPKDILFVLDASQSILQRKLDDAAAAVKTMIGLLRPEDRFNVMLFRDAPSQFQPHSVPASAENKKAALAFLAGLQSSGATDVYRALSAAITAPETPGMPSALLIISDGRPTAGIVDGRTIINNLTDGNASRRPIYAVGGGNTVNRYLLDLLAYRNRGDAHIAQNLKDFRQDLLNQFARISDPILDECRADFGGIEKGQVFPEEMPDFYLKRSVTVYGRFDPKRDKDFVMRLTGRAGQQRKEIVFKADLANARTGDDSIARDWAFQRIYFLIGEMCRVGEKPELVAELRRLSSAYRIKTSYSE